MLTASAGSRSLLQGGPAHCAFQLRLPWTEGGEGSDYPTLYPQTTYDRSFCSSILPFNVQ